MNNGKRYKLFLLSFVGLIVAFGFLEIALRFPTPGYVLKKYLWPIIFDNNVVDCRISDPVLHHALEANCSGRVRSGGDFDVEFSTNSHGLRSPEITKEKPDGVFRILVLGDSFTEGWGVEDNETFSRVMEDKLKETVLKGEDEVTFRVRAPQSAKSSPDDKVDIRNLSAFLNTNGFDQIEVINAGVGSYSPILELTYLIEYGINLAPDLVIVMLDSNDAKDDYFYGGWNRQRDLHEKLFPGQFREEVVWPNEKKSLLERMINPSRVFSFVRRAIVSNIDTKNEEITIDNLSSHNTLNVKAVDWEDYEKMYDLTGENLSLMKKYLNEKDIDLIASISSRGIYYSTDSWCPGRERWGFECGVVYEPSPIWELEKQLAERDIMYIDTFSSLIKSREDGLYYPNDGHWTAKAHKMVGLEIAHYLIENSVVKDGKNN